MNKLKFPLLCIVFLLVASSLVHAAASARIVTDTLSPTCTSRGQCKDLYVEADAESAVRYTVNDVKVGNYTVSFMYKLQQGKFEFSLDPDFGLDAVPLADVNWRLFSKSFEIASDQDSVILRFRAKDAAAKFWLDDLQLVQSPEYSRFNNFKYEVGCCPLDYCWNGTGCMHSKFYEKDVTMPPLGWDILDFGGDVDFLSAPNGYRCINGTWKFSRIKFTPLYDKAGYCPDDDQCYNGDGSGLVEKACTSSGDFIDYSDAGNFYCYKGNWTTRTKEIALQLLNMTTSADTYTLFCDDFNRALNPDKTMRYYRDYVGDDISRILTLSPALVNEFCVLDLNGQVIVGVSLNKEINESSEIGAEFGVLSGEASPTTASKSFLQLLKGSNKNDYCDDAIENREGAYNPCAGDDVYYNAKLKTVLFTKMHDRPSPTDVQSVPIAVRVNFIDQVIASLKQIFQNLLGIAGLANPQLETAYKSQLDFVAKAGSFNKLYLSFSPDGPPGGRQIKAIRETRATISADRVVRIRTFLSAEYHNYQTDICNFFYVHNYPFLRQQISKQPGIECTPVILGPDSWMYSVYVEEPFFAGEDSTPADMLDVQVWAGNSDSFWNDITAAIRTQEYVPIPGSPPPPPPAPSFTMLPEDPVVGTKVNFSLTLSAEEDSDIIARTWDFGDHNRASSRFNITTFHNYTEANEEDGYDVSVRVMDRNFKISEPATMNVKVGVAPQISLAPQPQTVFQTAGGSIAVEFTITGGHPPYNLFVDNWGDDSTTEVRGSAERLVRLVHTYTFEEGDTLNKYRVSVRAVDRDGVEFSRSDEIEVEKSWEGAPVIITTEEIPSEAAIGGLPPPPESSSMAPGGGPATSPPTPIR